jgi:hypothetical protein
MGLQRELVQLLISLEKILLEWLSELLGLLLLLLALWLSRVLGLKQKLRRKVEKRLENILDTKKSTNTMDIQKSKIEDKSVGNIFTAEEQEEASTIQKMVSLTLF